MELAIASDEISFDFETAVTLGMKWGVSSFELKRIDRERVPDVPLAAIAEVERVLADTGTSLTSLAPGLFKDEFTPAEAKRELSRMDRSIELAERLGLSRIVVFGFSRSTATSEGVFDDVIETLDRAASRAGDAGVTLLLENEPAFWVDCPAAAIRVLEAVASPHLKLNWDPCNSLACSGEPYPSGYALVQSHVAHVHVKDGRLRDDGSTEYVDLGTGEIDWLGQFRALIEDDFDGFCVLEPHFGNRVASSRAAVHAAQRLLAHASSDLAAG